MNQGKRPNILFFVFALVFLISWRPVTIIAKEGETVFSTWQGFEADKCASIWLIKRFIDKRAVIKFFPKGEIITDGISFDVPEATLRRYHNMSTFETLLKHFELHNTKLIYLGNIIHDIEINIWGKKVYSETQRVQTELFYIIESSGKSTEVVMEECLKYFDSLYNELLY